MLKINILEAPLFVISCLLLVVCNFYIKNLCRFTQDFCMKSLKRQNCKRGIRLSVLPNTVSAPLPWLLSNV